MSTFKKGDKVTVRPGATSVNGRKRDPQEVRTVVNPDWGRGALVYLNTVSGRPGNLYRPEDLVAVQEGPQWSDVEVGDTVTARLPETGDEVVLTAYASGTSGSPLVLDAFTGHKGVKLIRGLELVSIEKPKPVPPSAPGSVVLVHSGSGAWPKGLPLLRQRTGRWVGQNGQSWSDRDVAYANGGTFEVIHDAGKDASDG